MLLLHEQKHVGNFQICISVPWNELTSIPVEIMRKTYDSLMFSGEIEVN